MTAPPRHPQVWGRRLAPAQNRLDPRHQLARIEWLCHVVVGPEFEPHDLVDIVVAGGQHDDGEVGLRPDLAADFPAVQHRQHEIQHDEIRGGRLNEVQACPAIVGAQRRVALLAGVDLNQINDILFVVDDQNGLVHSL
jgi:hypothetical protein